jgi:hypothetical protein
VLAGEYVRQERFGGDEFLSLSAYLFQVLFDHLVTSGLVTMQDESDLVQAEADALAGLNDAEPAEMLFGVLAVPGPSPVGYDDPFITPMAQHVGRNPEFGGDDSDPHPPMMPS